MYIEPTNISTEINPRLQRLLERRYRGITTAPTASTQAGEIAVIAKVSDIDAWQAMSEVLEGVTLGSGPNGETLVTARVPLAQLEKVRQAPWVISLQLAQRLKPVLAKTIEEIGARVDLLPLGVCVHQGQGVVIGIIDFECDFAHKNFRHPDGSTRLLAIWNQRGPSHPDSPYEYGKVFSREEINFALQAEDPYAALGYGPSADTAWKKGAHGTHVMDIAAGNGYGTGTPGVAPAADLVFVDIAASDIPWVGEEVLKTSFGDSVQLIEAINYIFELAGDRPCVINVSLGTNGGPHDGTTLVEQAIDFMVSDKPNRAVVIAAGNSYDDGTHAVGVVPQEGYIDLQWDIRANKPSHDELEVWYGADDEFCLELLNPDGQSLGKVDLGSNGRLSESGEKTLLFVAHRQHDPNNGDNVIGIFLESGLPGGIWTVRLHGTHVQHGHFHAWIERNDDIQSCFVPPHDKTHTLGSISCGYKSIVVGSYNARKTNKPLSSFSSSGPTRDGRPKPEISAPGDHVWAAYSRTGHLALRMSGTSMAAPAVTGVVALMLAEAQTYHLSLTIDEIRHILTKTVVKNPPDQEWHERYGYGRVDAKAVVLAVQALVHGTEGE